MACPKPSRTLRQLLELVKATIKQFRIPSPFVVVIVLPECMEWPTTRNWARGRGPPYEVQGGSVLECRRVACTRFPPAPGGIDDRIAMCDSVIRVRKILDPIHHCCL